MENFEDKELNSDSKGFEQFSSEKYELASSVLEDNIKAKEEQVANFQSRIQELSGGNVDGN